MHIRYTVIVHNGDAYVSNVIVPMEMRMSVMLLFTLEMRMSVMLLFQWIHIWSVYKHGYRSCTIHLSRSASLIDFVSQGLVTSLKDGVDDTSQEEEK